MPLRTLSVFVAIPLTVLSFVFSVESQVQNAPLDEGQLAFEQEAYAVDDTAVFHIRNSELDVAMSCTATWVDVSSYVSEYEYWNMFTGEPHPGDYQGYEAGCAFESATSTPVHFPPDLDEEPWSGLVDDVETSVVDYYEGEFTLATAVNASSTVAIPFYFDAPNTYATTTRRAKVTSGADPMGEWVGISEVASTTDSTPHNHSGVFRGSVALSIEETATTTGDGMVRVGSDGDTLLLAYYDDPGSESVASTTASVEKAIPVPAASAPVLVLAAGLFTLLIAWRLRHRPSSGDKKTNH